MLKINQLLSILFLLHILLLLITTLSSTTPRYFTDLDDSEDSDSLVGNEMRMIMQRSEH